MQVAATTPTHLDDHASHGTKAVMNPVQVETQTLRDEEGDKERGED
jgi:hypothetical protein